MSGSRKKSFPPCQLCNSSPASCRSHIIPRGFYSRIRGSAKHLYVLEVEEEISRGFTQNGIWEQGILCPTCDRTLGQYDEYAYEVLPERIEPGKTKFMAPGAAVVELGNVDRKRFQLFLVALIWRASRSSHGLFRLVRVGSASKRLRAILTGQNTSFLPHIDCVFVHLDPPRYGTILFPPSACKSDGVDVLQFYLYPWKLLIKFGQRPFSPELQRFSLNTHGTVVALVMNEFSSGENRVVADLRPKIKAHHERTKHEWP
jgi:hypothetical protein